MDDRRLREYALKIYKGESGYSLQKAFRLFPKYYHKIAFFYEELLVQKQKELNTRMFQALGIDKAIELRNITAASNKDMEEFRTKAISDLKILDKYTEYFDVDKETAAFYASIRYEKNIQILKDVRDIALLNGKAIESVKNTAKYYGFNDIFSEAESCLKYNTRLLGEVCIAVAEAEERIDQYEQKYQYKE